MDIYAVNGNYNMAIKLYYDLEKVLADEHFGQAVKNTAYWTIFSVLGEYLVGMVTAVLLNQKFKGRAIFRTCIFIPWLVPLSLQA